MRLADRRVVVTGGPTREWLDPVRFLSNPSSGKMGIALADEVHRRGADTVFIHGPIQDDLLAGKTYRTVGVETTGELLEKVMAEIRNGSVLIMAAAPSDYTPVEKSGVKIKKGEPEVVLRLRRTPDILKNVSRRVKEGELTEMTVVGFAAETVNTEEYARGKLEEKDLDMICLNDVSRSDAGFARDTNRVVIFERGGARTELPTLSKAETASRIVDVIERLLEKK